MIRQDLVDAILAKMKLITKANGFRSDCGLNCFEWYEKKLEHKQFPAIIIRDPESPSYEESGVFFHSLKIEIDIAVIGKDSVLNNREIISDILKSFKEFKDESNRECKYGGSETLIEQKDFMYGGTRLIFTVEYESVPWEQ